MSNDNNPPSDNPYQANAPVNFTIPAGDGKPQSIVVFGILNLVFAAVGLCGVFGAVALAAGIFELPQEPNNPVQQSMQEPTFKTINIVFQVLSIPIVILLLGSGIGLLNGRGYGRTLAIAYCYTTSVVLLAGFAINIMLLILPNVEKVMEMPDGPEKIPAILGLASLLFQPCGLIYPVILLIFMYRSSVKNYLRSRGEL